MLGGKAAGRALRDSYMLGGEAAGRGHDDWAVGRIGALS